MILWGCFEAGGSGALVKIDDIVKSAKYHIISVPNNMPVPGGGIGLAIKLSAKQ